MKALQDDDDDFMTIVPAKTKAKKKIANKKENIELIEVEEDELICRCSPDLLMKTLKNLNTKQKNIVHDMGFGTLYCIRVNKIPWKMALRCLNH